MKKFINEVDDILHESLRGFARAHAGLISYNENPAYVTRSTMAAASKVALVSGGGSGHEPLHAGFVGQGMLDGACPGAVFTSPTPDQMLAVAEIVDHGAGVLFIVKNYEGDVMNFEMATEMMEGQHASVITNDDVAVEASTYSTGRRGVAGTIIVEKITGALAEEGADLEACRAMAERVNAATRSMGVALTSCTVPAAGKPTFDVGDDEIEMGVGIHGEPGRKRIKLSNADPITLEMMDAIIRDLALRSGDDLLLFVNGFGGTPLMELYLMFDCAARILDEHKIKISRQLVGNYCTSLDMAGCSITITKLDPELKRLWDAPVHTAALRW